MSGKNGNDCRYMYIIDMLLLLAIYQNFGEKIVQKMYLFISMLSALQHVKCGIVRSSV